MNLQFTGRIIETEPIQQGMSQRDGKPWASQNYIIEELDQQYPSRCVFKVFGSDKIQQFGIQVGEVVTAHLGIKANKSKDGRWFNSLDCWKVDRFGQQQPAPPPAYQQAPVQGVAPVQQQMQNFPPPANTSNDNLPF